MKLFLKPTAIFACIALLFCACGEDSTEDLTYGYNVPVTLDMPVDVSVASGNGRAAVTWRVPDDSNITHAMIQWDNATEDSEATMNEITRIEVIPTQKKTYEIGAAGDEDPEFPTAGDYNFTVTLLTVNSSNTIVGRSEPVSVTKDIYNDSTYENSRPNPYNIKTEGESTAVISWSRFDADFLAVKLFYTNTDGEPAETDRLEVNSDSSTTTLEKAKFDENFSFYSYFKPTDGLDTIAIAPSETSLTLTSAAASPTNVSVVPGIGRMRVQWMVPSNEDIISTVVKYQYIGDTSGESDDDNNSILSYSGDPVYIQYGGDEISKDDLSTVFYGEDNTNASIFYYTEDVLINNRNERFICGDYAIPSGNSDDEVGGNYIRTRLTTHLTAGYYEVKVYNIKSNGAVSSPTDDDDTIQTIHVYDETNTFVAPTLSGVPIRSYDGVVTFDFDEDLSRWNNGTAACSEITIYYYTEDDTYDNGNGEHTGVFPASIDDLENKGLSGTQVGTTFYYTSTFAPSGTFDTVLVGAVSDDNTFIPDVAPSAPKSVSTTPSVVTVGDYGNYETQTPLMNVSWIPADEEDGIAAYRVYWYSSEAGATTYRSDYIDVSTLTLNSEGAYEYTITENLVASTKYSVEVASASSAIEGMSGRTESDRTGVVVMPTAYGYDTYRDVVLSYSAVKNNGDTATIMWSSFDADCIGAAVYYYNSSEGKTLRYPSDVNEYSEISAASLSTPLEDALTGSDFTYIAYYTPTGGDAAVKVKWTDSTTDTEGNVTEGTQVGAIPNPVPVPAGLALESSYVPVYDEAGFTIIGYSCSIDATWSDLVDADRVVDRMYIRYYSDGSEAIDTRIGVLDTSYTLPPTGQTLESGTIYYVQLVTEDTGAQDTDGNNLTSESDAVYALAYDADTYTTADLPIGTAVLNEGTDSSTITISWSNIKDDLQGIYLTYGNDETYNGKEMISASELRAAPIILDYEIPVTEFTFTGSFLPAGGTDPIIIEGGYGMATDTYDGDGMVYNDETGEYEIYTAAGFKEFADMYNAAATTYASVTISLMKNLDMSSVCNASADGESWTPIGAASGSAFNGTFKGNNCTIASLYVYAEAAYKGLFGYTGTSATIQDVILSNPVVVSTSTHVGALVGYAAGSEIINCHIKGSSGSVSGTNNVGGVVGFIGSTAGYVIGCTNASYVYGSGTATGGIVGYLGASSFASNCVNYGTVESDGQHTGGIAGQAASSFVQLCTNAGPVTSTAATTGGIVGYVQAQSGSVTRCANEEAGVVTGTTYVGGIIGNSAGWTIVEGRAVIYDSAIHGSNKFFILPSDSYTAQELVDYDMKLVTTITPGGDWNKGEIVGTAAGSVGGIVGRNDAANSAFVDPYGGGDTYRVWYMNNYYTLALGGAITGTGTNPVAAGENGNVDYSDLATE